MAFSRASRGLASLIERDGYGGRGVSSTFPECVELGFAFESWRAIRNERGNPHAN